MKAEDIKRKHKMAIFLHVGHSKSVRTRDIVGIFDMDTSTVSRVTKNFLNTSQKKDEVENTTTEIPKSFILVCKRKERKPKTVISQLAVTTLTDRLKRKI